jgi:glycosyltransferase involved in cell wall biosynthesis
VTDAHVAGAARVDAGEDDLRVAVVHDYLTQRGGAERVVLAMLRAFPGARLLTSVYNPDTTFAEFRDVQVETTPLNRVAAFRRDPRLALPLLPRAFSSLRVDDVDLVLASSSGWAHGVTTRAPKLVYCYNPARWLYQQEDYVARQPAAVRTAFRLLRQRLTQWDRRSAATASRYLTSSSVVKDRIYRSYKIDAGIVPPPVTLDAAAPQSPVEGVEPGYFLVVGRARGYKNVSVVCEAFANLPHQRLVVVGGLPEGRWPANLEGRTGVTDAELRWLYAHCTALVAASHEDFGLTPLEANSFGRPALVLRAGGFLDTLDPEVSGLYIEALDAGSVGRAVQECLGRSFDPAAIVSHADRYSEQRFAEALRAEALALTS